VNLWVFVKNSLCVALWLNYIVIKGDKKDMDNDQKSIMTSLKLEMGTCLPTKR